MFQTLFVYSFLLGAMFILNEFSRLSKKCSFNAKCNINTPIFAILIFALVFGIRYHVGVDHEAYISAYEHFRISGNFGDEDIGYAFLTRIFAEQDLHYSYFFFFVAFLQLFLVMYALRENSKVHGFVIILFFLSSTFLQFMNLIRQELGFALFAIAIYFLSKRSFIKTYAALIIACTFHISAIILLPIPFLYIKKSNYFSNVKLQLVVFFLFFVISIILKPAEYLFTLIPIELFEMFGYEGYYNMVAYGDTKWLVSEKEAGFGFYITNLICLCNILFSSKVKSYFNSKFLNIIYDLYFIGILYRFLVSGSLILSRINYYFFSFGFIVSSFTLYFLLRKSASKKSKYIGIGLIILYVLMFYAVIVKSGIANNAIYRTIFDVI